MEVTKFRISVILGALGVVTGAFGAHMLKSMLTVDRLQSWKTAVFYLFIHTLVMLLLSSGAIKTDKHSVLNTSWTLFFVGILLFCGSIFLLSLKAHLPFSVTWLGPITPIGGVCFIAGWLYLLRV